MKILSKKEDDDNVDVLIEFDTDWGWFVEEDKIPYKPELRKNINNLYCITKSKSIILNKKNQNNKIIRNKNLLIRILIYIRSISFIKQIYLLLLSIFTNR